MRWCTGGPRVYFHNRRGNGSDESCDRRVCILCLGCMQQGAATSWVWRTPFQSNCFTKSGEDCSRWKGWEGQWGLICKGTEPNMAVWIRANCRVWKGTSEISPQITAFPDLLLSGCLPLNGLWCWQLAWTQCFVPSAGAGMSRLPPPVGWVLFGWIASPGLFVLFLHFVRPDSPVSDLYCWF